MENQKQTIDQEIDQSLFAQPMQVDDPEDCNFYHVMDIPGLGIVGREWDLRDNIGDYLGNYDFTGKRVLDVGTASGFLTFEMEKRGGDVVSFDMESGRQWNLVPHYKLMPTWDKLQDAMARGHKRLQNAYWYTHKALNSKAKAYYGDVYNLPETLGSFDVVLFGMILSHLRDPFQALYSGTRLSRDTVIVTNQTKELPTASATFLPNEADENQKRGWWSFNDETIETMLAVLGFKVETKTRGDYLCIARDKPTHHTCTTFIAKRIAVEESQAAA